MILVGFQKTIKIISKQRFCNKNFKVIRKKIFAAILVRRVILK